MSDYLLSPGFFDEAAQQDPAWLEWSRPERITAQVDRLFAETLPGVTAEEPQPDADRYSNDMAGWVCERFDDLFPDEEALTERENHDLVDQFVCYFGETLRVLAGGEWFNARFGPEGAVLFDQLFTPAIGYRWEHTPDDLADMVFLAVEADGGTDAFMQIGTEIYSRSVDYAHERGVPHEFDEVRAKHGLA